MKSIKNQKSKIKRFGTLFRSGWVNGPLALFLAVCGLAVASCGHIRQVVTETKYETITNYVDSLRIKDSIRVIPIERYVDIVAMPETLHLETSLAAATAYYDSTFNALRGEIHNKKEIEEHHTHIEHSTAKADTIRIYQEVPKIVEKEVVKTPRWAWYSLLFNILLILFVGIKIYLKIKKIL